MPVQAKVMAQFYIQTHRDALFTILLIHVIVNFIGKRIRTCSILHMLTPASDSESVGACLKSGVEYAICISFFA